MDTSRIRRLVDLPLRRLVHLRLAPRSPPPARFAPRESTLDGFFPIMLDLCGGDTDKAVESMNHLMQEGNMEIRREDYPPGLPPPPRGFSTEEMQAWTLPPPPMAARPPPTERNGNEPDSTQFTPFPDPYPDSPSPPSDHWGRTRSPTDDCWGRTRSPTDDHRP
jgi:hypothetical protein